jgi:5-methylthioadenosine/S-adenosylhomocysteine deaminase
MEKNVLIIEDGYVLTCDPANRGGKLDVLIRGDRIAGLAPRKTLSQQFPEAQVIDATDKLVIPALVNAHFHSESLLLRPLTDGLHFGLWPQDASIRSATAQLLRPDSYDDVRRLTLASAFAHVKCGTGAVADFPPAFDGQALQILAQAVSRAELRSVLSLQTWQQVEQAEAGLKGVRGFFLSLGADQDFTVYNLSNLSRTAREMQMPLLAHVAERQEDEETVRRNFQKSLGQVLRDLGLLRSDTVLVHANYLPQQDLELIEEAGCTIVLCARSAALKQTGYPLLRHLAARNIRLALGSDWANTDIFEEMRFLAQLPRLVSGMPAFSPLELLRMATINGAVAIGMAGEIGSIEMGKRADVVFLSTRDLRLPMLSGLPEARELAEYLVTHLTAQNVTEVMINGQFAVSNGELATMTEADVLGGFRSTLTKWYTPQVATEGPVPVPSEVAPQSPPHAKIIPFVAREVPEVPEHEGFEEGFTVIGPRPGIPKVDQSSPRPSHPVVQPEEESLKQPELPTDVRREFGEDDDV